jgi:hypothetical protein
VKPASRSQWNGGFRLAKSFAPAPVTANTKSPVDEPAVKRRVAELSGHSEIKYQIESGLVAKDLGIPIGVLDRLVTTLCPKETAPCEAWNFNEGDGLNAADAAALAAKLEALQDSGEIAGYYAARGVGPAERMARATMAGLTSSLAQAGLEAMAPEQTGFRSSDVDEFVAFLKASGGFSIW